MWLALQVEVLLFWWHFLLNHVCHKMWRNDRLKNCSSRSLFMTWQFATNCSCATPTWTCVLLSRFFSPRTKRLFSYKSLIVCSCYTVIAVSYFFLSWYMCRGGIHLWNRELFLGFEQLPKRAATSDVMYSLHNNIITGKRISVCTYYTCKWDRSVFSEARIWRGSGSC